MVSIANLIAAIAIICGHTLSCTGFTLVNNINNGGYNIGNSGPLCAATDDASAQALSDYMAKSHEEKLKAVRDVEDKKNSQIQTLKAEIQQLKTSSALATTTSSAPPSATVSTSQLANANVAELESKLASYQSFMADYIVKSQNEKLLAVKEAELKAEKTFQERLEKLFAASGMVLPESSVDSSAADSTTLVGGVGQTSFQERNAQVVAAANAGKSRWGDMEVNRAIKNGATAAAVSPPPEIASTVFDSRNAQIVAAANAGKSRWGDMEVHRAIKNGATAAAVSPPPEIASTVFDSRNAQVVAAANAGKSRWGNMEVERAVMNGATAAAVSSPTEIASTVFDSRNAQIVAAANAGKSRWGDMEVERAVMTGATAAAVSSPPEIASTVFGSRNAQVVAAANAGKSRWGDMEVERAVMNGATAAVISSTVAKGAPSVPVAVTLTLEDRLNLGASLVVEKQASDGLEDRINLGARLLGV